MEKIGAGKKENIELGQPIRSHLRRGIKPIMVCVGKGADFSGQKKFIRDKFKNTPQRISNINWHNGPARLNREGYLNAGLFTYVMSKVDGTDKFSESFYHCTGLIVAGRDSKTGENISLVTHQYPASFLYKDKDQFIQDLEQRLRELKERCESETVDAILVGGAYFEIPTTEGDTTRAQDVYIESVKLLGEEVKRTLGFEPIIINGPKLFRREDDDLYYDNDARRLYFLRTRINQNTGDFQPSEVEKHRGKW